MQCRAFEGVTPPDFIPLSQVKPENCPSLGLYPFHGNELLIKATPSGIVLLKDYPLKLRYKGSKTCVIGLDGSVWPKAADYKDAVKNSTNEFPERLFTYRDGDGLYRTDKEKLKRVIDSKKSKKKAAMPDRLTLYNIDAGVHHAAISPENSASANILPEIAKKVRPRKDYSINKKEVRQRIMAYINTARGQKDLFFWTVSFPEGTPDDTCYKAFNTWLTTLRTRQKDKFGKLLPPMLKDYLWVAERQMGDRLTSDKKPTYTIHFHIAIPHYMPVNRANTAMRTTLKNLAKKGLMPGAVCNAKTKQIHYLPCIARYNGVHIGRDKRTGKVINFAHKRSSRALAHYLTKYITKNAAGQVDEITGKVEVPGFTHLAWHNSRGFSCLFTSVAFTKEEFAKFGFRPFVNAVRRFEMEFATFWPWLFGPPPRFMKHLFDLNSYIHQILDNERAKNLLPS